MTPTQTTPTTATRVQTTALRQLYAWIAIGLAITAATAWIIHSSWGPASPWLLPINLPILLTPSLGNLFLLRYCVDRIHPAFSAAGYATFAALLGAPVGYLLRIAQDEIIPTAFAAPTIVPLTLCFVSYATNRDTSGWKTTWAITALALTIISSTNIIFGADTRTWLITVIPTLTVMCLTTWSINGARKMAHAAAAQSDDRLAARIPITAAIAVYLNPLNTVIKAVKSRATYLAAVTTWSTAMIAVAALQIYEGTPQAWYAAPYIALALSWGPQKRWLDTPINHSRPLNILRTFIRTAAICSLAAAAIYSIGIYLLSQDPSTPPELWQELGRETALSSPDWNLFVAFFFGWCALNFLSNTYTRQLDSETDQAHTKRLYSQNVDKPRSQPKPPCPRCGPTKTIWLSPTAKFCRNCRRRFD